MTVKRALERTVHVAVATAFVLRAAARVAWHEPRTNLPELAARLRTARRARTGFDVALAHGVAERLLPILPPWGAGRCVKRSLIQLDLWTRAGHAPRLHLGLLVKPAPRAGHVWVSTDGAAPPGVAETWSA